MKIQVYSWRTDSFFYLEGKIIKEYLESIGEDKTEYRAPDGSYSLRKYFQNYYRVEFETRV